MLPQIAPAWLQAPGGPVRPSPGGSPILQAAAPPPVASAAALDRPGTSRGVTGPPAHSQATSHSPPASLSLGDRLTTSAQFFGYGTRPGPNLMPAGTLLLQPRTRICTDCNRPLLAENPPPTSTKVLTSISPDGPTVSDPRLS